MSTDKKNTKKASTKPANAGSSAAGNKKAQNAEKTETEMSSVKPIELGHPSKVESVSTGTLILKFDLLEGLTLKAGDEVTVNGDKRVISNVTKYDKKKQISIATQGYGKWPVGEIEVTFKSS